MRFQVSDLCTFNSLWSFFKMQSLSVKLFTQKIFEVFPDLPPKPVLQSLYHTDGFLYHTDHTSLAAVRDISGQPDRYVLWFVLFVPSGRSSDLTLHKSPPHTIKKNTAVTLLFSDTAIQKPPVRNVIQKKNSAAPVIFTS